MKRLVYRTQTASETTGMVGFGFCSEQRLDQERVGGQKI